MKVLSHRRAHDGPTLAMDIDDVEEPGGIHAIREVVVHGASVAVLAVHEDGRIVLIRQYRHAARATLWELPGGRVEKDEPTEAAAGRELEEEAGVRAGRLEHLSSFHTTPGFCDEKLHLYRATALTFVGARLEADEGIEASVVTLEEALGLASRGEVQDAKTLVALLLEERRRSR